MRRPATLALLAAFLLPAAAWAQESFELRGSGWVNSRDLSLDRLRGKVVVLYFFSDQ